ncbi:MAG: DUF222 domain-containing protein [Propionicimonas sp.]|uniref:HNH endonuclease signature motif containing protein n=1 Tax=Propionicimonas sp. TaxID=1955623 RepID=UPI002B1F1BE5|nr:DUF222 domain-containing protein [Propionicimonas sp.]MEA4943987.1 DUF222 domain-containing protein [Propionicimonas sp.]
MDDRVAAGLKRGVTLPLHVPDDTMPGPVEEFSGPADDDLLDHDDELDEFDDLEWDPVVEAAMLRFEIEQYEARQRAEAESRRPHRLSDAALVDELAAAERAETRAKARKLALLAELEARGSSEQTLGLSAAGWLVNGCTRTARQARGEVLLATRIAACPPLAEAVAEGQVSIPQAERLAHGLARLPDELDAGQREAVATHLVGLAISGEHGPDALSRLVNRAVEVVASEVADAADQAALERVEREQYRSRHLTVRQDLDGAWLLSAKLPAVAGAQVVTVLNAMATKQRSADALAEVETSWGQAMADALVAVFGHHSSCGVAPVHGADRPRITVTVGLDTLRGELGPATLVDTDTAITAGQARRLACDAGILPMIMGSDSTPLDIGREKRLFTGALRHAIITRDRGCVFPGCDRPPSQCECHHRVPWWAGGATALSNGMLLCDHHHHLIEPDPHAPPGSQWEACFDSRGLPYFLEPVHPRYPDRPRRVRQHHRFHDAGRAEPE